MSATMSTTLGTSNLRNTSRQTRTNPTRTSKTIGSSLRQNSLSSTLPVPIQGPPEPHGFYPAIQQFADAITALPRDYRRHTSLLKEVDAKAWQPEEALQTLLVQCSADKAFPPARDNSTTTTGVSTNHVDEVAGASTANSVTGGPVDVASQHSGQSAESTVLHQRQLFAGLRHNLMQIMVTMDEKNHVINNANEELSRHVRRLDNIWSHIAEEISEEARLGSLKHWAYTETNQTKKAGAQPSRRDVAANLAGLHDNGAAQRSETRREAVAAKSKSRLAQMDATYDEVRPNTKKPTADAKRRAAETVNDISGLGISATGVVKGKKSAKGGLAMEKSLSAVLGGRAMSREPSQQDNGRKRKAPATSTVARKRLNANQDSPRLASSPLASNFGKDAYKRSPALASVRPVSSRAKQNTAQGTTRPASSASQRKENNAGVSASTPELKSVAAATGKTANEVKHTMKETINSRGERLIEDDGDAGIRGGLLLERRASKQGGARDDGDIAKSAASPRLATIATTNVRSRASKTSTPILGSFAESEAFDSVANDNVNGKSKRNARPKVKDHGLHDSLSPRDLPSKRSHKKGASQGNISHQRLKEEIENTDPSNAADEEEEDDDTAADNERYCYCNGVSYGEMVACDNPKCPREWFHLECIGLKTVPKSAQWWCEECLREKDKIKKKVNGNGNGGGR